MNTVANTPLRAALVAFLVAAVELAQAAPFQWSQIFLSTNSGIMQFDSHSGGRIDTFNNNNGLALAGSAFDATGNLYVADFAFVQKMAGPADPHTATHFGSVAGPNAQGYNTPESVVAAQ